MIGKTISHYNILEKLGEGGMSSLVKKYNKLIPQTGGVVYKAFDTKLERDVALKLLRPEAIGDPTAKERFHPRSRGCQCVQEVG
jgi:serine/threonine protein kinase